MATRQTTTTKAATTKAATTKAATTKAATTKAATTKAATTKAATKTPTAASPPRPRRSSVPVIEVDDTSPPDVLYRAGRQRLPSWQDKAPRKEERRREAVELLRRAAEAGHEEALDLVAGVDRERGFEWAVRAAKAGNGNPLNSRLTNSDHGPDGLVVLEAANRGEPWAMYAVGVVYGMGMCSTETDELVATRDGGFGWLPGVKDPEAESVRLIAAAADAGFAVAALDLATDLHRADAHQAALSRVTQALAGSLLPTRRRRAARLLAKILDDLEAPVAERLPLYEQLAESGDGDALVWLAERARDGDGVARDLPRARALFERAAAMANVDGLREFGRMCEAGQGGPVDEARARDCYEQAAEYGADRFARERLVKKFGLTWYARGADEDGPG
jgi:TPR repeat protein